MSRIAAVAVKEFIHLQRDQISKAMIIGIPLIMTLLFGYAINHDVRHLRAGVADDAGTSTSRLLLQQAQATGVIDIVHQADGPEELQRLLAGGEIVVGIYVPQDLETRMQQPSEPLAQLLVDGSDPVVLSAARGLMQMPPPDSDPGSQADRTRIFELLALYNPERRSPVFIVPGLCGVILALTMVLFTAVALVRERERGNLELLITTPVTGMELMLGKIAPYVVIGYFQATLIIALGVFLFDVPVLGSFVDFYVGVGLFVISILTLGLVISTLATNQFQAFQMTFMSFLPQMLLSGFMFPFEGMPKPAQWLSELFPLTHFLRVVRGIILRDADLGMLWPQLWPLGLFFVFMLLVAAWRFEKRLD